MSIQKENVQFARCWTIRGSYSRGRLCPSVFLSESLLFPRMSLNSKSDRKCYRLAVKREHRKRPSMSLCAGNG